MTTDYQEFRTQPLPAGYRAKWVASRIIDGTLRSETAIRNAVALEIKAAEDALAQRLRNDRRRQIEALEGQTFKRKVSTTEVCAEYFAEHPDAKLADVARIFDCSNRTARSGRAMVRVKNEER